MTTASAGWPQQLARDVRANPAYRLVASGALDAGYRRSLEQAGVDLSTTHGLLIGDRAHGLADKLVDAAGAELFTALRQPGPAPQLPPRRLAALVLDGVIEVETGSGFVSGPLAYEAVVGAGALDAPGDRLGRLSHAALQYAQRLRLSDVDRILARLYHYNRVPLAARWTRAYPDARAVDALLRGPALSLQWDGGLPRDVRTVEWLSFSRRDDPLRTRPDLLPYKLYVSPAVEALPDVLGVLGQLLTDAGARRFKVGPDAFGLLRPDKIVVYMPDARELGEVARALAQALDGVPPHGVPFTAELAGDGLLSWGGDPAPEAGPVGEGVESWRLSVSRRLAEYLATAQRAPLSTLRPYEFALARLALDGVDVRSFAPAGLDPPAPCRQPATA